MHHSAKRSPSLPVSWKFFTLFAFAKTSLKGTRTKEWQALFSFSYFISHFPSHPYEIWDLFCVINFFEERQISFFIEGINWINNINGINWINGINGINWGTKPQMKRRLIFLHRMERKLNQDNIFHVNTSVREVFFTFKIIK